MKEKKITRRDSTPIMVRVLPTEKENIAMLSKQAGMSMASYLRTAGQCQKISSVVDYEYVIELARINGDLGRLGGLLKLFLTNSEKTKHFGTATIRQLLSRIEVTQNKMVEVMGSIVKPRGLK